MDVLQDTYMVRIEAFSISAGLDYPGIDWATLTTISKLDASYVPVTDEAEGFKLLSRGRVTSQPWNQIHCLCAVKLARTRAR